MDELKIYGFKKNKNILWGLNSAELYEEAIRRSEGQLANHGALITRTGQHTGRSPQDKFIVKDSFTEKTVWWKPNQPFSSEQFNQLYKKIINYLEERDIFVQDCFVGADPEQRYSVRVITEMAWHSIFVRNMFFRQPSQYMHTKKPNFTIFHAPHFKADPQMDGTRTGTFIILSFEKGIVIIGGTAYAGEIKKAVFSLLNYFYPERDVFPMHSSLNVGHQNDVALFFGLSGTGKTTLSADPDRTLIGDDEHGWSPKGTFNFEQGCYAKVIRLSERTEPEIFSTTRRFGTIIENVVVDPITRKLFFNDDSITENTRASYPISYIPHASESGCAGHPRHIVMLTADAFGIFPPVAKLTTEQAMYHFISGYTAKVAGTEMGVTEPEATFSTCFGAPFMPRHSLVYADLLAKRIKEHSASVWLVNTGWNGGPYGIGSRISLPYTRAILRAIFSATLSHVPTMKDPVFGLAVPQNCPDIPKDILNPRETWRDKASYDKKARELANLFIKNFKQFELEALERTAGPRSA